jgi:hypothetical protein
MLVVAKLLGHPLHYEESSRISTDTPMFIWHRLRLL